MASSPASCNTVQHVTKASSDQLLRKFAELDDPAPLRAPRSSAQLLLPVPLRRKRSRRAPPGLAAREAISAAAVESPAGRRRSGNLADWKALLPPTSSRRSTSLARRMGISRSELGPGHGAALGLLLAALEKTWRKTVESASKVFVEKQCNRHIRLISDAA